MNLRGKSRGILHASQRGLSESSPVKGAQGESENNSRKQSYLLKNRHSDSLKKSQLTLSQGMTKKGDVVDDADDNDAVRTTASQNCATALPSYQQRGMGGGAKK
jgi:hypothetical protein